MPFRLAVMADGPVGQAVLNFLLTEHAEDVVAIVLRDDEAWSRLPRALSERCPNHVLCLTWATRSRLARAELTALLLAWWPYLLKDEDLKLAPTILNFHPSLLPHCRGKDPNFWALVEERPYGVTIHHVDRSIDGGAIAFQHAIPVSWEDTGESLYRAAERASVDLFVRSYAEIASARIPAIRQDTETGSLHYRKELDSVCLLDLDREMSVRRTLNLLRARTFAAHPACRFIDGGTTYEVTVSIRKAHDSD